MEMIRPRVVWKMSVKDAEILLGRYLNKENTVVTIEVKIEE
jgi:hypothetical protein